MTKKTADPTTFPATRRAQLIQQLLSRHLDIQDVWTAADWTALCDAECRRGWTLTYSRELRTYERGVAAFTATLTAEQAAMFADLQDRRLVDLNAIEQRTAFELGRDLGAAAVARPPAIERFLDVLQFTAGQEREGDRDDYREGDIEQLRRALPVAKAIIVTGNTLQGDVGPLEEYLRRERERVLARPVELTDPGHECALAAANNDGIYYVALALGLLLSEVL